MIVKKEKLLKYGQNDHWDNSQSRWNNCVCIVSVTHCIHFLLFILLSTLFSKINNPKETFLPKWATSFPSPTIQKLWAKPYLEKVTVFGCNQRPRSILVQCIRSVYVNNICTWSHARVFKQNESDRRIISYILHRSWINCNPQEYHKNTRKFMGRRCCLRTPFQRNSNLT